jgi:cysteinyl-tRNA synthetase
MVRNSTAGWKWAVVLLVGLALSGCNVPGDEDDGGGGASDPDANRDFRQDMMDLVQGLSAWARQSDADFIVIPQNGQDIFSPNSDPADPVDPDYLAAISGIGREDLFYGYDADDVATPTSVTAEFRSFLDLYRAQGKTVMVIDYVSTAAKMNDSYAQNDAAGYIGFAADRRNLDNVPTRPDPLSPHNHQASSNVTALPQIKNFLYIINPGAYATKARFLSAVAATNHDLVLVDAFDVDNNMLTAQDLSGLKRKADGSTRLAISYMSIGEAEDYRYYWQPGWQPGNPAWLDEVNPNWPGNYVVRYWDPEWQAILYGNADSYLRKILSAGFDGVYLDLIDAFEYWESKFE